MQLVVEEWWTRSRVTNIHVFTGVPQIFAVSVLHSFTAVWIPHPCCMQRVPSDEFGTLQNSTTEQLAVRAELTLDASSVVASPVGAV
jgi:hypothetical protein